MSGFRILNPEVIEMTEAQRVAAGIMADRPLYVITDGAGNRRAVYYRDIRRDMCQNTLAYYTKRGRAAQ